MPHVCVFLFPFSQMMMMNRDPVLRMFVMEVAVDRSVEAVVDFLGSLAG